MKNNSIRVCTSKEMREIDRICATEYGIPEAILMENAGKAALDVLLLRYPQAGLADEVLIFAGKGNNAGDAFVLARRLLSLQRKARIFHLAGEKEYEGATAQNFRILQAMKAKLIRVETVQDIVGFFQSASGSSVAVDGLIGTGIRGPLDGIYYDVVEEMNRRCPEILSLDIPSGTNSDTGAVLGTSVQASVTVSMGFPKLGHFLYPGAAKRGELYFCDISIPGAFREKGDKFLLQPEPISKLLLHRDRYGHKNTFGHTLLVGGSPGRVGAIALASRACHRMGTGLVTVATWPESHDFLLSRLADETMTSPVLLDEVNLPKYGAQLPQYTSIVVGPGLGQRPEGKRLLELLLQHYRGALVLDADALNLIAEHELHDQVAGRREPTVLTPHPGEMARLIGMPKEEVVQDPIRAVREAVSRTHAVVVLKGAATFIACPDNDVGLHHYPNDGMATAGSGDVLAGMIGGLLGQGMDPLSSAQLGVFLHGVAGAIAAERNGNRSMTASDLIENLGGAFQRLRAAGETKTHAESIQKLR